MLTHEYTPGARGTSAKGRRAFLMKSAGAALVAASGQRLLAQPAQFRFKCGTDAPESHLFVTYARKAAERIQQESGGKVSIEVFPSSQLGTSTDMLSQVRSGALEMIGLQGATLSTLVPVASISAVGFAFKDYPAVWTAMDGELGALIRSSLGSAGLALPVNIWDSGFRLVFTKNKPVASPADLKNLKIRVPVSPLWLSMFRGLGTAPVAINVGELYSALQTGIADGCELPLSGFESVKGYEVQKHCAVTNHIWDGYWPAFNGRTWAALPAELQTIVVRNFNMSGLEQRKVNEQLTNDLVSRMEAKGLVFSRPAPAPFRDTLAKAGFYDEWKKKFGPQAWGVLERYTGTLS